MRQIVGREFDNCHVKSIKQASKIGDYVHFIIQDLLQIYAALISAALHVYPIPSLLGMIG
jgi:hypothetical protein